MSQTKGDNLFSGKTTQVSIVENELGTHPGRVIETFSIVNGSRGKMRGFSSQKGKVFGHILKHPKRYERFLVNANELLRAGRGRKLALECNKFREAYLQDGFPSLRSEVENRIWEVLAEFCYLDIVGYYCIKEWEKGWANLGNDLFSKNGRAIRSSIHKRLLLGNQPMIEDICVRAMKIMEDNVHYLLDIGVLEKVRPR